MRWLGGLEEDDGGLLDDEWGGGHDRPVDCSVSERRRRTGEEEMPTKNKEGA